MNLHSLRSLIDYIFGRLSKMTWIAALLTRLFVGYFFMESGWAKVNDLATFTMRFAEWGIPFPAFNAALSAYTEFLGGALTIAGLGTRFVSVAMIINMAVAILSVKLKHVSTLSDFAELDEPLYALTYVWLLLSGPGWLSVDGLVKLTLSPARGIDAALEAGREPPIPAGSSQRTAMPV